MNTNQKAIEDKNSTATKKSPAKTTSAEVKAPADVAKAKEEARKIIDQEKPKLNFESTLKILHDLQVPLKQRRKLLGTIENLESFQIDIKRDEDELGGNSFQACTLKISDDNRNEFSTKNPVVIAAVADFVKELCTNKLAEIEATIVLP